MPQPPQNRHHTATTGLSQGWMQLRPASQAGCSPPCQINPELMSHTEQWRGDNHTLCCPHKSTPVPFLILPRVKEEYNFHSTVLWLLYIYTNIHTQKYTFFSMYIYVLFIHVCVYIHIHMHKHTYMLDTTVWTERAQDTGSSALFWDFPSPEYLVVPSLTGPAVPAEKT